MPRSGETSPTDHDPVFDSPIDFSKPSSAKRPKPELPSTSVYDNVQEALVAQTVATEESVSEDSPKSVKYFNILLHVN